MSRRELFIKILAAVVFLSAVAAAQDVTGSVQAVEPDYLTGDNELTAQDFTGYGALKSLDKPIALGEVGPKPATSSPKDSLQSDYRKLIASTRRYEPDIVYWFSLSVKNSMCAGNNDHAGELLDDPWVITRDEIPNLKHSRRR